MPGVYRISTQFENIHPQMYQISPRFNGIPISQAPENIFADVSNITLVLGTMIYAVKIHSQMYLILPSFDSISFKLEKMHPQM